MQVGYSTGESNQALMEPAIDKLCNAFSVDERSSYAIKNGEEVVLKLYWTPLTIADRDKINQTLQALKTGDDGGMGFAVQMLIQKAEDENGDKLFQLSLIHI